MEDISMKRVNYIGLLNIFVYAFVFAVIGMSLPPTINYINNLNEGNLYGIWCSYAISMILFYVMVKETDLVVKRESYVLRIKESIERLNIKLKKRKSK